MIACRNLPVVSAAAFFTVVTVRILGMKEEFLPGLIVICILSSKFNHRWFLSLYLDIYFYLAVKVYIWEYDFTVSKKRTLKRFLNFFESNGQLCNKKYKFFYFFTGSKNVSGCFGSKISLHVITVTRFSVSDKLIMLCVHPGII